MLGWNKLSTASRYHLSYTDPWTGPGQRCRVLTFLWDCNSGPKEPRTPTPSPIFRLRLQDAMCDILIVFRDEWRENPDSSNKRCTSVYNSVQAWPARITHRPKPRTNILGSVYNHGVGLHTWSQSLPEKQDSDSRPKPGLQGTPTPHPWSIGGGIISAIEV